MSIQEGKRKKSQNVWIKLTTDDEFTCMGNDTHDIY